MKVVDLLIGSAAGMLVGIFMGIYVPNGKPMIIPPMSEYSATQLYCPTTKKQEGRFISEDTYRILPAKCYWECREWELKGKSGAVAIKLNEDFCEFK